jgi:dipeptidyl aminopeptidase/acylaminoacyl peptidase
LLAAAAGMDIAVPDCAPAAFPGDNGLIAFSNYDPGNLTGQIATVTAEADGTVTPIDMEGVLNDDANWSPDGTRIAFYSVRDGNREVYIANADGTGQVRITDNPGSDYLSTWTSDGQTLLFSSNRDGDYEIYRVSTSGGVARKLTDNTADDILSQASPSCDEVVFVSLRDGDYELFKMDLYGRNQTQITFNTSSDLYPDWSPDGAKIAFASEREGSKGRDVWIMNADGSDPQNVISRNGSDTDPVFSPDGTMLAWSGDLAAGTSSIFMAPVADLGDITEVASNPLKDRRAPDWQPLEPDGGFPSAECQPLIICGDATEDFDIKASDALQILRAGVGQPVPCIRPRCDTDDSESIVASDAQRVLRFAVGQSVTLSCPLPFS